MVIEELEADLVGYDRGLGHGDIAEGPGMHQDGLILDGGAQGSRRIDVCKPNRPLFPVGFASITECGQAHHFPAQHRKNPGLGPVQQ